MVCTSWRYGRDDIIVKPLSEYLIYLRITTDTVYAFCRVFPVTANLGSPSQRAVVGRVWRVWLFAFGGMTMRRYEESSQSISKTVFAISQITHFLTHFTPIENAIRFVLFGLAPTPTGTPRPALHTPRPHAQRPALHAAAQTK